MRLHLILPYSNRTEKALKEKDSERRETEEEKKKILEKKEDRNQVGIKKKKDKEQDRESGTITVRSPETDRLRNERFADFIKRDRRRRMVDY